MGLMHVQDHGCEQERKQTHMSSTDTCIRRKPVVGPKTDMEILMSLKQLAIMPFRLRNEYKTRKPIFHQVLKIREVMLATNATTPQRKRRLPQLTKPNINDNSGFALKFYDDRNSKKIKGYIDVFTPVSCTHELETQTTEVLADRTTFDSTDLLMLEDKSTQRGWNSSSSGPGSSHQSLEVPSLVEVLSCEDDETVVDWESSIYNGSKQLPIPIGPHFQADIPEWTGRAKFNSHCNNVDSAEDLRWLGTRVWPLEVETRDVFLKDVRKGRNDNCSCLSPGSTDCVNQHILEERLKLQSELGSAFQVWQIDEMGEAVTKSWTTKEHKAFNSLVKKSMLSSEVNFWTHASKCFPGKSDKDLTHYFLNVFIPRCIGLQTRLSHQSIDTDGNEDADDDSKFRRKCKGESSGVRKSKYLRGR